MSGNAAWDAVCCQMAEAVLLHFQAGNEPGYAGEEPLPFGVDCNSSQHSAATALQVKPGLSQAQYTKIAASK